MAGHSHWAGIKHKKALVDSRKGKLWSKLSKAIIVAARLGGGDLDGNHRLRQAVLDARAASMPKDNIERAIKKGTGELAGGDVEEVLYEGYGPGGVAVMCDIMTDNRNRTASEVRKIFDTHDGKLGSTNCVAWMFERKGLFVFDQKNLAARRITEERLMEAALEAGAEDVKLEGAAYEVLCEPEAYTAVRDALEAADLTPDSAQIARIPSNTVELDTDTARKVLRLLEALDDHDDVQNVSANYSIPDDALAELAER